MITKFKDYPRDGKMIIAELKQKSNVLSEQGSHYGSFVLEKLQPALQTLEQLLAFRSFSPTPSKEEENLT